MAKDDRNRKLASLGASLVLAVLLALGGDARSAGEGRAPSDHALAFVDPELQPFVQGVMERAASFGSLTEDGLQALRSRPMGPAVPPLPDVPASERTIPVGEGSPDVTIQIVNAQPGSRRPGILHMHGGGYILGSAKSQIRDLQELARALDCVVVSVEYRLAPETRYTGSVEDNYAGLKWMFDHAAELGLDASRIAVMGESAGGGHAALLAITARDRGEVPVVFQALIYPMLDDRTGSSRAVPSHIGAFLWTAELNRFGWRSFIGLEPGDDAVGEDAVPARVSDLSGLPPAFIGVGSIDLFVREDTEYALRLMEAGVATELLVVPGAFHAFDRIAAETTPARKFTEAKLAALRRALHGPSQ